MGIFDFLGNRKDGEIQKLNEEVADLTQKNQLLFNPDNFGEQTDSGVNPMMMSVLKQSGSDFKYQEHRPPTARITMGSENGARIPLNPFPLRYLYQTVKNIDALRIPIDVMNREVHRNGFVIEPKFRLECKKCGKQFQDVPVEESEDPECDICGNKGKKAFRKPEVKERQILVDLESELQNENDEHFIDISKRIDRDLNIADDAYLVVMKEYTITNNKVTGEEILSKVVASPEAMFVIADSYGRIGYNDSGRRVFVCPQSNHRDKIIQQHTMGEIPPCPMCGCETLPAVAELSNSHGYNTSQEKTIVYAKGEVLHIKAKYWQDLLYGYSPIFTVISKAITLFHMDEYFRKFFDKMRPPKGALFISTSNRTSLKKSFEEMYKASKRDPYTIYPIMVENERGNRNFVQYVNFAGNLNELQLDKVRDEFRRTIGAMYGVLPMFSGDLPNGWNQEGLQTMVVNRAVSSSQDFLQKSFYNPLVEMLGVHDWVLKLEQAEETDLLREAQIQYQNNINAQIMQAMGFSVELDSEGKFVFSDKVVNSPVGEAGTSRQATMEGAGTQSTGEHKPSQPSDAGGVAQGHPASGDNTSRSMKSVKKGKSTFKVKRLKKGQYAVEKDE